jgi:hypothetical protein
MVPTCQKFCESILRKEDNCRSLCYWQEPALISRLNGDQLHPALLTPSPFPYNDVTDESPPAGAAKHRVPGCNDKN